MEYIKVYCVNRNMHSNKRNNVKIGVQIQQKKLKFVENGPLDHFSRGPISAELPKFVTPNCLLHGKSVPFVW